MRNLLLLLILQMNFFHIVTSLLLGTEYGQYSILIEPISSRPSLQHYLIAFLFTATRLEIRQTFSTILTLFADTHCYLLKPKLRAVSVMHLSCLYLHISACSSGIFICKLNLFILLQRETSYESITNPLKSLHYSKKKGSIAPISNCMCSIIVLSSSLVRVSTVHKDTK